MRTATTPMATKNKHTQRSQCPLACGLDIVGDHWTLIIVRDLLMMDRHEFRDMLDGDEGISSNILSDRLTKLQKEGLVKAIPHPASKRRKLYYLTSKGKDLIHVVVAVVHWSNKYLSEHISITEEHRKFMTLGPEAFIKQTLRALDEWEQRYQIS